MRDFNLSISPSNPHVDVLNFKIFSRNSYLDKIIKIVREFVHYKYPEVDTSDQIYYYKLSKPIDLKNREEPQYEAKQVPKFLKRPYRHSSRRENHDSLEQFIQKRNREFIKQYKIDSA